MRCYIEYIKRYLNINKRKMVFILLLLNMILYVLNLCGCISYQSKATEPRHPWGKTRLHSDLSRNPLLFFDRPAETNAAGFVSSEQYGRYDWPLARAPQGYVNLGESITYREYYISDQYISADNTPRLYFHRRIDGYRYGSKVR